jgi:hypothetical protein
MQSRFIRNSLKDGSLRCYVCILRGIIGMVSPESRAKSARGLPEERNNSLFVYIGCDYVDSPSIPVVKISEVSAS